MWSVILIAVATFVAMASGLLLALLALSQRERRLRLARVMGDGDAGKSGATTPSAISNLVRVWLRNITERVSIMSGGEAVVSATLLRLAGYRDRDALIIYSFLKLVLPFFGAALGFWAVKVFAGPDSSTLKILVWVLGGGLLASKLPDAYLKKVTKKRMDAIQRSFPDMLELLVISSEAGLAISPAMLRVSQELAKTGTALASELGTLAVELGVFSDRQKAWRNFEESLPLPEISLFSSTLQQAERYGTPFSDALRQLMRDQRIHRMLAIEEKAGRIPALMTIPLIIFIMPALFIVLIGPAALSILDSIINK